jgi:hypothetical protein
MARARMTVLADIELTDCLFSAACVEDTWARLGEDCLLATGALALVVYVRC